MYSMQHNFKQVQFVVVFVLGYCLSPASAQAEKKYYKIELRVFSANDSTLEFTPLETATINYRNPDSNRPNIAFDLAVTPSKERKGFVEVQVLEGLLIEELLIRVTEPNINPAIISKVVVKNNMVVYPGASSALDNFRFRPYIVQMSAYRNLYAQFVEEASPATRKTNRRNLRLAFGAQIKKMANIERRLPNATSKQKRIAAKLSNEILKLYGLPQKKLRRQPYRCSAGEFLGR